MAGRTPARVLVPVTLLACGVLFAASATTAGGTDLRADRRLQLTELIAEERREVARTEERAAALRAEVAERGEQLAAGDAGVAQEQARGDALEVAAGLTAVEGPAITVSLDDAPPDVSSDNPNDLVVHQQDVQAVVNALWAGGAEAMTLMGQRVISTSAVRCVGNTVILHGRVYGPPFVVTAIGDRRLLRDALEADPGVRFFRTFVDTYGLGYEVSAQERVTLPAYDGPLELPAVVGPSA